MEEELLSLKQALRSLVVSSPTTMTVNSLLKDYRNLVGGYLPLSKFGYKDPITFLRERCTDVFVMEGPPWDPILTPKITKNLQHIDQMVQKQKVQSSVKFKGKRRSVPSTNMVSHQPNTNQHNFISQTFNKPLNNNNLKPQVHRDTNVVAPIQFTEPRMIQKQYQPEPRIIEKGTDYTSIQNNQTEKKHNLYNQSYKNDDELKHQDNKPETNLNNNKENMNTNMDKTGRSSGFSRMYKNLAQHASNSDFSSCDRASKASEGSVRQSTSSVSSTSKQAQLDDLKADILALIIGSQGVWCTDLIRLYKERYGRELGFNRFGYTSIISLVYSMEERIAITRPEPDGDWFLEDPAAVSAGAARAWPVPAARRPARYVSCREPEEEREDALPGVPFEAGVFPADCVHFVDCIPRAASSELRAGDQLEVMIGEVYSPSHFWIIRVGEQYNLAMEAVMDEMTNYYRGEGASRVLARGAVRVGQYCASEYEHDWHRSLIVALIDCDTVKVRHVDYGTVESTQVSGLKPLLRRWAELPAQAIRARLAGVRPAAAGRRWPRAACSWLLHQVRDTRLYANVRGVDTEEDIVETFLIDTRSAEDVCLTRELIRVGHADGWPDSALKSGECYLYPAFSALESGDTPNYADISRYLADGITLDYVDSYRRHVPSLLDPLQSAAPPVAAAATAATAAAAAAPPRHDSHPHYLEPYSRHATPAADDGAPYSHHHPQPSPCQPQSPAALPRPFELLTRVPLLRVSDPSPPQPPVAPPAAAPTQDIIPPPLPFSSASREPPPALYALHAADHSRGMVVQLSEAEWSLLTHLRDIDPYAAQWYLMTAAYRMLALQPPPPPPTTPRPH